MILKQIEIENVKSHKKTTIPFKKGLNVFYGGNGSGKSTVLEMIGFVLFDFLERKKHDIYVRDVINDKPQFGTIRLSVIGLNNEPYIIERTIGKASVAVYNALTNKELKQVSDVSQLKKWIRKQIGVSNNIELETLFETSIGIPQGTFLVPFQKIASKRKQYFDPILDLKIYEIVWEKLKQLIDKVYSQALQEVNLKISEIVGAIKDKSEIIEKRDRAVEEVNALTVQAGKSKSMYKIFKIELDKLREVKTKLEAGRQEVEKLKIKRDKEREAVSNVQEQVEEAKNASKICDVTKEKSEKYEKLFNKQSDLQLKLTDLQRSQNELKAITEECATQKTKKEGVVESKLKAEEAIKQLKNLTPKYERSLEIENEIKQNEGELTRIVTIEEEVFKKNEELIEKRSLIQEILNQVKEIPELEQKIEEFGKVEQKKDELKQIVNKIESKLAIFTQNRKELEEGTCPILNQPCINVKEGVANFSNLSAQIKEEEEMLKEKRAQLQLVQDKLEGKEGVERNLKGLEESRIKLGEIKKQETILQGEIAIDQEKTKNKPFFVKLKEGLELEKEELEPFVENCRKNKIIAEELPVLKESALRLEQNLVQLRKNKEKKEKSVKALEHVLTDLEIIQSELNSLKEDHNLFQANKKQAEQLPKKEKELRGVVDVLRQLDALLEKTEKLSKDHASQFDVVKFDQLETETKELEIQIATSQTQVTDKQDRVKEINEDLETIEEAEREIVKHNSTKDKLEVQTFFIRKMRVWLRALVPKMRKALINQINVVASEIYRHIREEEGAVLEWQDDYDIVVSTSKSRRGFFRLSGGERMSAALAVRLAILKVLTEANFAFFDEPTTNLDEPTRRNLSKYVHNIKGFEQLFVISHDDSFKRHSEYVVKFTKDENEITHIDYLTKKD